MGSDRKRDGCAVIGLALGLACALCVVSGRKPELWGILEAVFGLVLLGQAAIGVLSKRLLIPGASALAFWLACSASGLRAPTASFLCFALALMATAAFLGGTLGRAWGAVKSRPGGHIQKATLYREDGRLDHAVGEFRDALRLDPDAPVHGKLGILLAEMGRFDEAIVEFEAALKSDPKDAGAYFRLGMLLAGRNRLDEAVAAYEGFIVHCGQANPGHAEFARKRIVELKGTGGASPTP